MRSLAVINECKNPTGGGNSGGSFVLARSVAAAELIDKNNDIQYIAGGATHNSCRVAQWMMGAAGKQQACTAAFMDCVGNDAYGNQLEESAAKDSDFESACTTKGMAGDTTPTEAPTRSMENTTGADRLRSTVEASSVMRSTKSAFEIRNECVGAFAVLLLLLDSSSSILVASWMAYCCRSVSNLCRCDEHAASLTLLLLQCKSLSTSNSEIRRNRNLANAV